MANPSGKRVLKALFATYPHTRAIKEGSLASDRIAFDFTEVHPVWDGFDAMVRHRAFDVSEMAAVTYLLCMAYGKPMALLPAAMFGRFQHAHAITTADAGVRRPQDLEGKRVGVRSVTTTTGAWLRGHLAFDYGVDPDKIHWVTFEEPHVAECEDTSERAAKGKTIVDMLLAGELDAVLGETSQDPRVRTLFPDPQAEAQRWYAKHKIVPINHLMVVDTDLLSKEPETVREVWRLLKAGKHAPPLLAPGAPDTIPFGIEACRPGLEMIADYAYRLRLVPKRYTAEEMFAPVKGLVD